MLNRRGGELIVFNELNALKSINSSEFTSCFISKLYYAFQDPLFLYLCIELASCGDLRKCMLLTPENKFNEETAKFIAAQVILALRHIHSCNYGIQIL